MLKEQIIQENKTAKLTDLQNAVVSTIAVVAALWFAMYTSMQLMTGFFVVSLQNMAGLNIQGTVLSRLKACIASFAILCGTAILAVLSGPALLPSLLGLLLLCLSLSYWMQIFPDYWPSINIPKVVIYFMALSLPHTSPIFPVLLGASFGFMIQSIISFYLFSQQPEKSRLPGEMRLKTSILKLLLKKKPQFLEKESIVYGIQLLILLSIALIVLRISGYPHAYWMAFTIIIVLKINHKDTKKFTLERIFGTVIGCILGSILLFLKIQGILYLAIVGITIFLFTYLVSKHYVISVVFITIFVLLLIGNQTENPLKIALERIGFTIAGGVLTLIASLITSQLLNKAEK